MSINKLPLNFKPEELCKRASAAGVVFEGEMGVEKLLELNNEFKKHSLTPVHYHLRFYLDGEGRAVIEGEMAGDFELVCQRCLQPMSYTVKASVSVSPIASDAQAKQLPAHYEPLLMTNGEVNFAQWIAEELHLALPLVARHDTACLSHDSYIQNDSGE